MMMACSYNHRGSLMAIAKALLLRRSGAIAKALILRLPSAISSCTADPHPRPAPVLPLLTEQAAADLLADVVVRSPGDGARLLALLQTRRVSRGFMSPQPL